MDLELIIGFGIAFTYVDFAVNDSYIFSPMREKFEMWLKIGIVKGSHIKKWISKWWECDLCHNFWGALFIAASLNFPLYLALTSPVISFILKKNMKSNV